MQGKTQEEQSHWILGYCKNHFNQRKWDKVNQTTISSGKEDSEIPIINMDEFIKHGAGVCRHLIFLLPWLLQCLQQDKLLSFSFQTIHSFRGTIQKYNKTPTGHGINIMFCDNGYFLLDAFRGGHPEIDTTVQQLTGYKDNEDQNLVENYGNAFYGSILEFCNIEIFSNSIDSLECSTDTEPMETPPSSQTCYVSTPPRPRTP